MSKTFKTRPMDVQMFGKNPTVKVKEVHDHRDGRECNLPEPNYRDHVESDARNHQNPSCYWAYIYEGKNFFCGCPMCTAQMERKKDRRRTRRETRETLRKASKAVKANDLDALDSV